MNSDGNKTNLHNTVIINPIGSCKNLYDIQERVFELMNSMDSFKNDFDLNKILVTLSVKINFQRKRYKDVIKNISQYWGKYVHMKWSYNINYEKDREIRPNWNIESEYVAFLYRFNPENDCLFGIFCNINNPYVGGVKDDSIDLAQLIKNHRLEITEITEDEFSKKAQQTLFDCLKARVNKITSGEYNLTENGYEYMLYGRA